MKTSTANRILLMLGILLIADGSYLICGVYGLATIFILVGLLAIGIVSINKP